MLDASMFSHYTCSMGMLALDRTKSTKNYSGLVALLITDKFEEPPPRNEGDMTQVEQMADFVVGMTYEDLSEEARQHLKIRILDALGCAIGALEGPPIKMLHAQLE